ncbi:hypothetical protein L2E82_16597 [Cichorium intybus]|uniref:Uncharacterized protein n=1 Tax=Cichorium intybus TaxID=13427 RepID=A0ACB9F6Y7_CICIN|nr:hypothetical protein L2E82_16597 [Cichorium intybus]
MATVTGNFFRHVELPQQKPQDNGVLFPAVLSPNHITVSTAIALGDFGEAIRAHKPWVESSLKKSGAILFRGFPVTSPSDFNNVIEAFGYPELPYMGGRAARTKVIGRVYSANESPPEEAIPFHHEMAYATDRVRNGNEQTGVECLKNMNSDYKTKGTYPVRSVDVDDGLVLDYCEYTLMILPAVNLKMFYFPQGHTEHATENVKFRERSSRSRVLAWIRVELWRLSSWRTWIPMTCTPKSD